MLPCATLPAPHAPLTRARPQNADAAFARLVAEQERVRGRCRRVQPVSETLVTRRARAPPVQAFFLVRGGNANEMGDDQGCAASRARRCFAQAASRL